MVGVDVRARLSGLRAWCGRVALALAPLARALFVLSARGVAACAVLVVGVMVWAFALGYDTSPLASLAYVLCAWAFTALCVTAVRNLRAGGPLEALRTLPAATRLLEALHAVPLVGLLLDDRLLRTLGSAGASLALDLLWAVANAAVGVATSSVWAVTLGVYYLCLVLMRAFLLGRARTLRRSRNARAVRALCRGCGVAICAMTAPIVGIVVLNLHDAGTFTHHMYVTIGVAAYSFTSLGVAVSGFARYRGGDEPILLASSSVSLVTALASFLTMGILMLNVFSGEGDDGGFRVVMTSLLGLAVAAAILMVGVRLVARSRRAHTPGEA